MIEDFEGYKGRISDMNWTYKGTKTMLLPMYDSSKQERTSEFNESDGYTYATIQRVTVKAAVSLTLRTL
ncbi:MAG: hypothetical protein ACJA2Y_001025 [Cycloclasticus pugetii]|jgi:hypothetical protein